MWHGRITRTGALGNLCTIVAGLAQEGSLDH